MKLKYAVIHLFDIGSSHPEVDVEFFTTRAKALAHVNDHLLVGETFSYDDEAQEWALGDDGDEGWIRIDEVKA